MFSFILHYFEVKMNKESFFQLFEAFWSESDSCSIAIVPLLPLDDSNGDFLIIF